MLKVKRKDLTGFLEADTESSSSGGGTIYLLAAESDVFRQHSKTFLRTFLVNHAEPSKFMIHVVLFDNNVNYFKSVLPTGSSNSVIFYDYFQRRFESLEQFYQEFRQNCNPHLRNVLVIDKLNLFNCYCNSSNSTPAKFTSRSKSRIFFRHMRKYTHKIFGTINASVATSQELNEAYDNADLITLVMDRPRIQSPFFSYVIKNRSDTKPTVNKVIFDIVAGEIQQIGAGEDISKGGGGAKSDFDMGGLTTFKLTLNEYEKETKNKLHLPYFDAQRKNVTSESAGDGDFGDSDEDDDTFDDEEDEEV